MKVSKAKELAVEPLPGQTVEELATIFKALSDPNRLAILELLRKECGGSCRLEGGLDGSTVSAIADCFEIALSTVSHHLKELKNAGLIDCVKRGQWVHCAPNAEALRRIERFVEG